MHWTQQAEQQAGLITYGQLLTCGQTESVVRTLVSKGILVRRRRGLYHCAGAETTPRTLLWFAVLATGGVVRGQAAAYVHRLDHDLPTEIGVYIPFGPSGACVPGVACARLNLAPSQHQIVEGLPVTSRVETVLDCIGELPLSQAVTLADRARTQGWIRSRDVQRRLLEQRRGNRRLRQAWQVITLGGESTAERILLRLLREAGITGWQAGYQVHIDGRLVARVDFAFPAIGLAIEVDGFAYHSSQGRFQHDRSRQNALVSLGWRVLRFTWYDLQEHPDQVLAQVRSLGEQRGAQA